jgi:hypothetical protein
MADQQTITDIQLGAPATDGIAFIPHVAAKPKDDKFEANVPGHILRCGGALYHSLRPAMVLSLAGLKSGAKAQSAVLVPEIVDTAALYDGLYGLADKIGTRMPLATGLKLIIEGTSAKDVVDKTSVGCDCSCSGAGHVAGEIRLGASAKEAGKLSWTDRIAVEVHLLPGDDIIIGPIDENLLAVPAFLTCAASTSWEGWMPANHRTRCLGNNPCTAPQICRCGTVPGTNTPKVFCKDWVLCHCA